MDEAAISEAVVEYLAAEGLELDDLEAVGSASERVLRVTVDGPSLNVDRLADISRGLSRMLGGDFGLEVSSPGLERKLRRPEHYAKSIDREVTVKTYAEVEGSRRHIGYLKEADQEGIRLDIDGLDRRIAYEQVASARTVFRWEPSPKPGKKAGRSR